MNPVEGPSYSGLAMYFGKIRMFRRNIYMPSSGWKSKRNEKPVRSGQKAWLFSKLHGVTNQKNYSSSSLEVYLLFGILQFIFILLSFIRRLLWDTERYMSLVQCTGISYCVVDMWHNLTGSHIAIWREMATNVWKRQKSPWGDINTYSDPNFTRQKEFLLHVFASGKIWNDIQCSAYRLMF